MWHPLRDKMSIPSPEDALPGRDQVMPVTAPHRVTGNPLQPPWPAGFQTAIFGMGCFWGAERRFWQQPGVWSTAVGYAGGHTPNPTYDEVCTGKTGHNEVVLVVFDPARTEYASLLRVFWESHDPTQGMRQGNDVGTQYRSGIYCTDDAQLEQAQQSKLIYNQLLQAAGRGQVTTEVMQAPPFYYAEPYHQQYLDANPGGYCGLGGTGVSSPER